MNFMAEMRKVTVLFVNLHGLSFQKGENAKIDLKVKPTYN